jgi:hypothetical protein
MPGMGNAPSLGDPSADRLDVDTALLGQLTVCHSGLKHGTT